MSVRIGLLIPTSNTPVEPEFYRALAPEVTLHTARLFLSHISEQRTLRIVFKEENFHELSITERYLHVTHVAGRHAGVAAGLS